MKRACFFAAFAFGGLLIVAVPLYGQGYRARIDTRFTSVAYRGLRLDSVAAGDVVAGPSGGFLTPDGIAARCLEGALFCTYFRPGPERLGGPLVTTLNLALWGFGVRGLQVRTTARVGADVGDTDVWPGTDPAVQLVEGYLDYTSRWVSAQAGRTNVFNRFGFTGFDGVKAEVRPGTRRVRVLVYGGWGLARGVPLPVTSTALDPLDDFLPSDRQIVVGARLGWALRPFDGTVLYQREVDPGSDRIVSERLAFEGTLRPLPGLSVSGGADYDLSFDYWGTAEGTVTYVDPDGILQVAGGGRRYRPHFDLWSIWGMFSPAPYSSVFGSAAVMPLSGIQLRGRAEGYRFDEADAASPLASIDDGGWRWSAGATVSRLEKWTFRGDYHVESGPGAASLGWQVGATFQPIAPFAATAEVSRLVRPLEYRFSDSKVLSYALRLDYRPADGVRLYAETRRYDETRRRGDAAQFDWDQVRVNLGATLTFGSGADARGLHPAILRIPEGGRSR
jgi:hypothetical protein